MWIVSNAGPIASFARADLLDLLRQVVESLIIPDAVHEELFAESKPALPGPTNWIMRQAVRNAARAQEIPQTLHLGEREALVLAAGIAGEPAHRRPCR